MPLKLMYITNNPIVAIAAEKSGVDWIFIDLEQLGKNERQPNMNTVKSNHSISDISIIKQHLYKSKLLVRINPINPNSKNEIEQVIQAGADIIMLPYFKSNLEVKTFIEYIKDRVEICLLLETPEAVDEIDEIIMNKEIKYIHIGLNDLHLGYHLKFMFELLSNGIVEKIISSISKTNIIFGFGGIASLGEGIVPAEIIIAEHKRLNSQMVILSRTFYTQTGKESNIEQVVNIIKPKIDKIRKLEKLLEKKTCKFFINNKINLSMKVKEIVEGEK